MKQICRRNIKKINKAFTLIEMVISMAILSMIFTMVASTFVSFFEGKKLITLQNEIYNETNILFENIIKKIIKF